MRNIQWKIEEEGIVFALFDEVKGSFGYELGKVLAGCLHRLGLYPNIVQIMKACTMKKEVIKVVNEPAPYPEEFIEPLLLRSVVTMSTEVPLSEKSRSVTISFQYLSLVPTSSRGHVSAKDSFGSFISPMGYQWLMPGALRMATRHESKNHGQGNKPCGHRLG